MKKYKKIVFNSSSYNRLVECVRRRGRLRYPKIFLLGENKDGIIVKAVLLKIDSYNSCSNMSRIPQNSLHDAHYKLYKDNLSPCGIARVSQDIYSFRERWSGNRGLLGTGLEDICGIVASVTQDSFIVETYNKETNRIRKLRYILSNHKVKNNESISRKTDKTPSS